MLLSPTLTHVVHSPYRSGAFLCLDDLRGIGCELRGDELPEDSDADGNCDDNLDWLVAILDGDSGVLDGLNEEDPLDGVGGGTTLAC